MEVDATVITVNYLATKLLTCQSTSLTRSEPLRVAIAMISNRKKIYIYSLIERRRIQLMRNSDEKSSVRRGDGAAPSLSSARARGGRRPRRSATTF